VESMPASTAPVTVGVDTHLDLHVAAVLDHTGRLLGTKAFPASTRGYVALVTWAERFGPVERIGVEGTGTYGAGLARFVRAYGLEAVEVNRPDRSLRRRQGKSDPIDAQAAARATLAGVAATTPKTREGQVEMIRVLRVARRGALKARVAAAEQLSGVLSSAPEELRAPLLGLKTKALVRACAALRPGPLTTPTAATKAALRTLARRWQQLQAELTQLDNQLQELVSAAAPTLVALPGVGIDTAGQLLVTVGDNPQRLRSEAAFAHLCGAAPIPASSGRTHRHRLNRGGDRQANHALWRITLVRMHCHPPTRAYVERRTKQGLSKLDIMRCLIGGVSGARSVQESGRARSAGQGTAPLSCHPRMASLSSAAPGRAEPTTGFRTSPQRGPSIRHRRHGLASAHEQQAHREQERDRCLLAGTGPAPPMT
jgi:transposase